MTTPAVGRRPRHRHSPRIRRRAEERGIVLAGVSGTGPGGRVTEEDLDRAASSVPGTTGSSRPGAVAVRQVELGAAPPDRERLLAAAAVAGLEALRRHGVAATSVGMTAGDRTTVVPDAHDLTVDGLASRLAAAGSTAGPCAFRVLDAEGFDLRIGLPGPGEAAVLAVGAVTERVVVARDAAGSTAFAARPTVTVTVAGGADLPERLSADVLAHVARRLEPT